VKSHSGSKRKLRLMTLGLPMGLHFFRAFLRLILLMWAQNQPIDWWLSCGVDLQYCMEGKGGRPNSAGNAGKANAANSVIETWLESDPSSYFQFVIPLDHDYTEEGMDLGTFKGNDRSYSQSLEALSRVHPKATFRFAAVLYEKNATLTEAGHHEWEEDKYSDKEYGTIIICLI
jgi:hypothetical protein